MERISGTLVAVISSIIGLAIVAVIVSQRANTPQVLQSGGSALASVIGAAVSPVSGATSNGFGAVGQTIGGVTL